MLSVLLHVLNTLACLPLLCLCCQAYLSAFSHYACQAMQLSLICIFCHLSTQSGVDSGQMGLLQDDLEVINRVGQGRVDVTIGSALDLFGGPIPYEEVVFWHLQQRSSS